MPVSLFHQRASSAKSDENTFLKAKSRSRGTTKLISSLLYLRKLDKYHVPVNTQAISDFVFSFPALFVRSIYTYNPSCVCNCSKNCLTYWSTDEYNLSSHLGVFTSVQFASNNYMGNCTDLISCAIRYLACLCCLWDWKVLWRIDIYYFINNCFFHSIQTTSDR